MGCIFKENQHEVSPCEDDLALAMSLHTETAWQALVSPIVARSQW